MSARATTTGLAALAAAVSLLLPADAWGAALEVLGLLCAFAAVRLGMRRHRPRAVRAWRLMALTLACFAASSAAEGLGLVGILRGPAEASAVVLDLAGYLVLAAFATVVMVGGRAWRRRETWFDVLTLLLAAVLVAGSWVQSGGGNRADALVAGLGVLVAVVLVVGVGLVLPGKGRSPSAAALVIAATLVLAGVVGQLAAGDTGWLLLAFDDLSAVASVAVCISAVHPSMADLGASAGRERAVTGGRMVAVGAALLVNPALVLLWSLHHGGGGIGLAFGIGVLTVVALWRIGRLAGERERTRAALAASETRLRALLENAADVVVIVDRGGRISYVNAAVQRWFGRLPEECLHRPVLDFVAPPDRPALTELLAAKPRTDELTRTDLRLLHADGDLRWVEVKISGRYDDLGVDGWVVNLREITERKILEEQLRRQAAADPLTGLANRSEFVTRVGHAVRDPAGPVAVLFLDLDDFKAVNDRHGHAAGDDLLVSVARRLRHCVREGDTVARLGGDEFAVLVATGDAPQAHELAERILARLADPVSLQAGTVTVSASVGGALAAPADAVTDLLHRADTAMYEAKRAGKNRYRLLDTSPEAEDALDGASDGLAGVAQA